MKRKDKILTNNHSKSQKEKKKERKKEKYLLNGGV